MRDTELYRQLLGLESPWTVTRVELVVKEQRVNIWAGHAQDARWPCPECGTALALYDHPEERAWRHPDSCQFQTYLHARPPRVQCPTHGVRQGRLPWAEARARFTTLFERLAIDVLLGDRHSGGDAHPAHQVGRGVAHPGARGGPGSAGEGPADAAVSGRG